MEIHLNGNKVTSKSATLAELIQEKKLDANSLIVELNYEIVRQMHWNKTSLKDGDHVEFLRFVGGG